MAYDCLERKRPGQRALFEALTGDFKRILQAIEGSPENEWLTDWWRSLNVRLKNHLSSTQPAFSFLNSPVICRYMMPPVAREEINLRSQLAMLREHPFFNRQDSLLEDAVGEPPGLILPELSSANLVHHASDLVTFCSRANCDVRGLERVIEWGGGYGCMAKIVRRLSNGSTYCIVDSAIMCAVQWLYLATIFGRDEVRVVRRGEGVQEGKINLIPLAFLEEVDLRADLFLSTFALNESPFAGVDYVINRKSWFGARHLLVACCPISPNTNEENGNIGIISRALAARGARIEKTACGDDSFYAFR